MDNGFNNLNASNGRQQRGFAIASLVLGILSVVCCCCGEIFSLICATISIVFFIIDKKRNVFASGLAIAGLICSIFAVLICVGSFIISTTDFYKEFMSTYESIFESMLVDMEQM